MKIRLAANNAREVSALANVYAAMLDYTRSAEADEISVDDGSGNVGSLILDDIDFRTKSNLHEVDHKKDRHEALLVVTLKPGKQSSSGTQAAATA